MADPSDRLSSSMILYFPLPSSLFKAYGENQLFVTAGERFTFLRSALL